MTFNKLVAGAAVGLAVLSSPAAMAGALTGNVGVFSDYMFRGVDQTATGAAVQGGVDYAVGNGIYVGSWASNVAGGNEIDIYGGYNMTLGSVALDLGGIYYYYSETDEVDEDGDADPTNEDPNTIELYVGATMGPVAGKVFFSNDLAGSDEASMYATLSATLAFNPTLSFVPQIGMFTGDGAEATFGDEYNDYSLTLVKTLKDDLTASFAIAGSDRDDDDPKAVVGLKKTFSL